MEQIAAIITGHKIPVGPWAKAFIDWVKVYFGGFFDFLSTNATDFMEWVADLLNGIGSSCHGSSPWIVDDRVGCPGWWCVATEPVPRGRGASPGHAVRVAGLALWWCGRRISGGISGVESVVWSQ